MADESVITAVSDYLSNNQSKSTSSYFSLIKNWCYRQSLGLFPLEGDKESSEVDLRDHWTEIKRKNILLGRCVSLELGEDLVIASVDAVERNLSRKIISVKVTLEDKEKTTLTLLTEVGKEIINKKIKELKNSNKNEEIKKLEKKIVEGDRKFVYWQNNCEETPDMKYIEPLLADLNDIHEDMKWDRKKSRKQVIIPALRTPSGQAWGATIEALEENYVCLVTFDDETKPEFKISDPQSRQKDLWEDHYQTFNFLRRMLGIAHNTNKKKERQNNPEIEMMESQFLTFQQEKRELLEKGIREFIEKFGGNYKIVPIESVEGNWAEEEETESTPEKENHGNTNISE